MLRLSGIVFNIFFWLDPKEAKDQGFLEIPCFLRLATLDKGNSHYGVKQPSSIRALGPKTCGISKNAGQDRHLAGTKREGDYGVQVLRLSGRRKPSRQDSICRH